MGDVGADVHQLRDTLTTSTLGKTFKEFAHLKEEHNKHRFSELWFCHRHKTDTKGT